MKILVVEDNILLANTIKQELSSHFEVDSINNGIEALKNISDNIYDLIILDIMLPDISGIDILKNIRSKGMKLPVIMLTAKEALDDKVGAFDMGANDYITKPFYMEELVARIYAIFRTNNMMSIGNTLEFKDLNLDIDSRKLFIGREELELPKKQLDILEYLLINKGTVLLKEKIYDRVWGSDCSIPMEIVEVHISNLRKSLSEYDYNKYIKTKRGIGYIFDDK
ncbi:DNA-binding response regulator [Romboutsia weinsteinii]|uniref:Stage 0 sporulation protein A homolog n=1 Tax=Romboutsia weinsteinii TaxID=2020949 RepID=A0A371J8W9_9FIRM|nr:response regulator transcription factor [Romboutsia weinsteinii]RDY29118.1 DNA-binding response regulator [Romboutsia weinsteinii]